MKVLIAHNFYASTEPSGENSIVQSEARLLEEAGVEVHRLFRSSDEISAMSWNQKAALVGSPVFSLTTQRRLLHAVQRYRPDVVHLHNAFPLLSPWIIRTAHGQRVPVVQTVHNFRHACMPGTFYRAGRPCRDCEGRRVPLPAVRHSCYRGSFAQSAIMAVATTAHRRTWATVDRFLPISDVIAEHLRLCGIAAEQITVKPNAVPDPGRHEGRGEGLLYVGRLVPEKGVDLLLDAWERRADGTLGVLVFVGDGPMRDRVEQVAARRADVRWLGVLPGEDVRAHMRAAAAVVVPSLWDEPFGLVAVEALANSRPVLATRSGFLPSIVGEGATGAGWVVERTVEALAEALPVVRRDAAGLRHQARTRYEEHFSPDAVISSLLGVYEQVVRSARA